MRRLTLALCFLLACSPAFAVISPQAIWEVQPTVGADTNGGGFVPAGGVKTVTAATDLAIDATLATKVTAGHSFVSADNMKYLHITAAGIVSGVYVSGGSITGTVGQTCALTSLNNSSTATATVALTGTNTIALNTALTITAQGAAGTAPSTTATLGNGTATCSGTATLATVMNATLGWYQIVSTASNAATLDHAAGVLSTTGLTYDLWASIDYTQQAAAQVNIEGSAITATCNTNTITFTGGTTPYTPSNNDDGNMVFLDAGQTNITSGFYQITGHSASTWTISGSVTACTAAANAVTKGKMGGALSTLTPLAPTTGAVAQNKIFIKASGTMSLGAVTFAQNTALSQANAPTTIAGYTSVRGDGGRVTIQPSSGAIVLFTFTQQGWVVRNLLLDGTGTFALATAIANNGLYQAFRNVKINKFTANGILSSSGSGQSSFEDGEITGGQSGCTSAITTSTGALRVHRSYIHDNLCGGVDLEASSAQAAFNVISNNTGTGVKFVYGSMILFNTLDNNTTNLLGGTGGGIDPVVMGNLISGATTGLQMFTSGGYAASSTTDGNCYYNNAANRLFSDDVNTVQINGTYPYIPSHDVFLTASPYTNSAGGDYSLNQTPGGGASARQAALPGLVNGSASTGFVSCGAIQPALGGGGAFIN